MIRKRLILIFLTGIITAACHTNVTRSQRPSGQINPQSKEITNGPLAVSFNKPSYSESDTITVSLLNKTGADLNIALRCGRFLEMAYQKNAAGKWSENMDPPYMMMKCPTRMYTMKPNEKYTAKLPSSLFNSKGSFRLLVSCSSSADNSNQTVTSVPFEIR